MSGFIKTSTAAESRVIVALDYPDADRAKKLVDQLDPSQCRLKVGKELFTAGGPRLVEALCRRDFKVFLDLKYHDIPNTVAKACEAAAGLGVWMINVHALGGRRMMEAACEALQHQSHRPKLIAVTVLTSMGQADIIQIGLKGTVTENVLRLAALAKDAGCDGVVCSPLEVEALRGQAGAGFLLVTPGVRPVGVEKHDQHRVMSPEQAINAGSSYLVIGRPVTQADDPLAALKAINAGIEQG